MPDSNRQASIDSRRVKLQREIAIRVPAFDDFVTEYSSNVSTTGMFIVSEKPLPPGSVFSFEFSVADDWKLIRGKGKVVWSRFRAEGADRPAGMGVMFTELDAQSRRLIRWIVEKHIREGGKPFELEELRSAMDEALSEVLEEPAAPARAVAPTRGGAVLPSTPQPLPAARTGARRWVPLVITALAVVSVVVALFWLSEQGGRSSGTPSAADRPGKTSATGGEAAAASGTQAASGSEGASGTAAANATGAAAGASEPDLALVSGAVESWRSAWSSQDVDAYLASYARDFEPSDGQSRGAWARQRRQRVGGPEFIEVTITGLETQPLGGGQARAVFYQSYRSDRMSDVVRKSLDLVWEEGSWKIAAETVLDEVG